MKIKLSVTQDTDIGEATAELETNKYESVNEAVAGNLQDSLQILVKQSGLEGFHSKVTKVSIEEVSEDD